MAGSRLLLSRAPKAKGPKDHNIGYLGFLYWEPSLCFWADTLYLGTWTLRERARTHKDPSVRVLRAGSKAPNKKGISETMVGS